MSFTEKIRPARQLLQSMFSSRPDHDRQPSDVRAEETEDGAQEQKHDCQQLIPIIKKGQSISLQSSRAPRKVEMSRQASMRERPSNESHTNNQSRLDISQPTIQINSAETSRRKMSSAFYDTYTNTVISKPKKSDAVPPELQRLLNSFSRQERRFLHVTWTRTKGVYNRSAAILCQRVLSRLCTLHPEVAKIFINAPAVYNFTQQPGNKPKVVSMMEHSNYLAGYIDSVVNFLAGEPFTEIDMLPSDIGRCHAPFRGKGVTTEVWETFGQLLAETMLTSEGIRPYTQAQKAWNRLIALLVDQMVNAFRVERVGSMHGSQNMVNGGAPRIHSCTMHSSNTQLSIEHDGMHHLCAPGEYRKRAASAQNIDELHVDYRRSSDMISTRSRSTERHM